MAIHERQSAMPESVSTGQPAGAPSAGVPATLARLSLPMAITVVALAYVAAAWAELLLLHRIAPAFETIAPEIGMPWLAVGTGVAGLIIFGARVWPGVFLGSLVTWGVLQGDPWSTALPDAAGEAASIVAISWLLKRWSYRPSLERYHDVLLLLLAAALGRLLSSAVDTVIVLATARYTTDPVVRSVIATTGVYFDGQVLVVHAQMLEFIVRWWANSVAGVVLVVPLLTLFPGSRRHGSSGSGLERGAWVAAGLAWLLAGILLPDVVPRLVVLVAALVLVVWAALRFGAGIAVAGTLVFSMCATVGFALQLGGFAGITGRERVEVVWGFIGLLSGAALFLTPLLAARREDREMLAASVERYRRLFSANPNPMWAEDTGSGRILVVNEAALRAYGYDEHAFLQLSSRQLLGPADRAAGGEPPDGLARPELHRRADGSDLEVEVARVSTELEGAGLRVAFVDVVAERNDLRLAVLNAADRERERLGQEISEGLGPVLSRLDAKIAQLLEADASGRAPEIGLVRATETDAVAAGSACRQLTRGASPVQFASGNLLEALQHMPEVLAIDGGPVIAVEVHADSPVTLTVERSDHLYRITQDAVRAALLRKGTRSVHVRARVAAERITIEIEDDAGAPGDASGRERDELWPMDVRAAAVHAELEVGEHAGGGCRVVLSCNQAASAPQRVAEAPVAAATAALLAGDGDGVEPAIAAGADRNGTWWRGALLMYAATLATCVASLALLAFLEGWRVQFVQQLAMPWLVNGVNVAGLFLGGASFLPAIFLGTLTAWLLGAHVSSIAVVGAAVGETLGAAVAFGLLRRWGFRRSFERYTDLAILAGAAAAGRAVALATAMVALHVGGELAPGSQASALLAGITAHDATLFGLPRSEFAAAARWWLNGFAGITLVVPVIVSWSRAAVAKIRARIPEAGALLATLLLASVSLASVAPSSWRLPLLTASLMLVAWAATRFGVALASTATLLLAMGATLGYSLGLGPVAPASPGEGPDTLWSFIGLLGVTGLFLTTVVAEHEATLRDLRRLRDRYAALFEAIPRPVFAFDRPEGRITMVNEAAVSRYGYRRSEFLALRPVDLAANPEAPGYGPDPPSARGRLLLPGNHRTRSGQTFNVDLSFMRVDVGGSDEYLCFASDVTERNELRRRVLEGSDSERRRLAQELHDGLGQCLTGLHLGISSVRRALERGAAVRSESIEFVATAIRDASAICRQIVSGLSSLASTAGDLVAALRMLPAQLPPEARRLVAVHVDPRAAAVAHLPLAMREHLYQIAREAVNNAIKHAHGTQIDVELTVRGRELALSVADDGVGFDPHAPRPGGLGLDSLALRAAALHGRLAIRRRAERGMAVICECDVDAA